VQSSQTGEFVFVVKSDGTVEKRPVALGPERDGLLVVQDGLRAGEVVVIDGQLRLTAGAKVNIQTQTNAPPAVRPPEAGRSS
jgi:multidrug efflux system membrane fusion protein